MSHKIKKGLLNIELRNERCSQLKHNVRPKLENEFVGVFTNVLKKKKRKTISCEMSEKLYADLL